MGKAWLHVSKAFKRNRQISSVLWLSVGRHGVQGLIIMGHSTGCQDTVRYATRFGKSGETSPVLGYILQAPVHFLGPLEI